MLWEFLLLLLSSYNRQISGFLSVMFSAAEPTTAMYKWPELWAKPWGTCTTFELLSTSFYQGISCWSPHSIRPWPKPQRNASASFLCKAFYQCYLFNYSIISMKKYTLLPCNYHKILPIPLLQLAYFPVIVIWLSTLPIVIIIIIPIHRWRNWDSQK